MRPLLLLVCPIGLASNSVKSGGGESIDLLQYASQSEELSNEYSEASDEFSMELRLNLMAGSVGGVTTCNGRSLQQFYLNELSDLNESQLPARQARDALLAKRAGLPPPPKLHPRLLPMPKTMVSSAPSGTRPRGRVRIETRKELRPQLLKAASFSVGQRVEALYWANHKWALATVRSKNENGTYTVDWNDGNEKGRIKKANELRAVRRGEEKTSTEFTKKRERQHKVARAIKKASSQKPLRARATETHKKHHEKKRNETIRVPHPSTDESLPLIPQPLMVRRRNGSYHLQESTRIVAFWTGRVPEARHHAFMDTAQFIAEQLRAATGWAFPVQEKAWSDPLKSFVEARPGDILLVLNTSLLVGAEETLSTQRERYSLAVEKTGVRISAGDTPGIFYAFQTLRQLLPPQIFAKRPLVNASDGYWGWGAPCVDIEDEPTLAWRGAHLDVARHFQPLETIYKYIDVMSVHKLNVFHFHLVDDQGWRLEIKAYPKLTSVGSKRAWSPPGVGYYTQEDLRSIVAFARRRHIMVMPEIEMPGHSHAAISAYPELGYSKGKSKAVGPMTAWGNSPFVYNTRPETLGFLKKVLDEVLEIFPSKYIHIGGDEVPKGQWRADPYEKDKMKMLFKATAGKELQLQTWFVEQIVEYLEGKGRRAVGWNELVEGKIPKSVTIMSWTDAGPGVQAARSGYDVIMVPQQYTYLDRGYGVGKDPWKTYACCLTVKDVYKHDPVPEALPDDVRKRIKGYQFQVWTEYMDEPHKVEYMAWPRGSALAERMWIPASYANLQRLDSALGRGHKARLDALGIKYKM